jgi:hypothetical protein
MRALLLLVPALLCVSAQELELAWFGHDTVRAALDAEAAEFRFELGAVVRRLWAGLFAELLTHDWWEPARHAHACGIALRVQ